MEWIIGGVVIWFIIKFLDQITSNHKTTTGSASQAGPHPFSVAISQGSRETEDAVFAVFKVQVRGSITAPFDGYPSKMVLHIFDVTDGDAQPVLCALDQLQEDDSVIYRFETQELDLPYQHTLVSEPIELADVPIDFLTFPKRGARQLRFEVHVVSARTPPAYRYGFLVTGAENVLEIATTEVKYQNTERGYEDAEQDKQRIDELTVRLAMFVSASDGELDPSEGTVIREWLRKRIAISTVDEDEVIREKARFNQYLQSAYEDAEAKTIDLREDCHEIAEKAPIGERYDILELCLHVASADGVADKGELRFLNEIATMLSVDMERFRGMQEKALPVAMHAELADVDSLLGITADMTTDAIRKHLNKEYRKWNGRITHSDPAIRDQADEMLTLIAECRNRHVQ
jgi:tellurite resistance protein